VLPDVERVLVMTIDPGFGGQKLLQNTLHKLTELRQVSRILQNELGIGVDGGIDVSTMPIVLSHGANFFVAGTSIFKAPGGITAGLAALRALTVEV